MTPRQGIIDKDNEDKLIQLAGTGTSYYVPGKIEGTPVFFLVDTGASVNLLSKRKFELLPEKIKQALTPVDICGTLADGSKLLFHGRIEARGKLRQVPFEATF